jgi:hypothetical protein
MLLRSCKWLEAMISPNPDVVAELRMMGFGHGAIGAVIVKGLVYYIVGGRSMHSGRRVAPETVEDVVRRRYNIPESFKAFCNIVSLTAAKTRRMLEVSVACVRLIMSVTVMCDVVYV